ncbi:MAG: hypothetical protein ACI9CE_000126 [Flavobacterium sp.]|jgi:hypothetical protein
MTVDDFIPTVPSSLDELTPSAADTVLSGPTKVYKWKDENGIWQLSNREEDGQGAAGNAVETMELDGDINICPLSIFPRLGKESLKKWLKSLTCHLCLAV